MGIATLVVALLVAAAIVLNYDRRHPRMADGDLHHGTVLSVHLGEMEIAAFTDRVVVRVDDGRAVDTGTTKLPVIEGCRVTLQRGRTRLCGSEVFRIIAIDGTGEPSAPGYRR